MNHETKKLANQFRDAGLPFGEIALLLGTSPAAVRRCMDVPANVPLTPPQVAAQLGVSPDTVLAWIRSGELLALNVGNPKGKRPRFRVEPGALAEFKRRRAPEPKPVRRRRAKRPKLLVTRYSGSQAAMPERGL